MQSENSFMATRREMTVIARTEDGLRAAAPLLSWFRSALSSGRLKLFDMYRRESASAQGFFDQMELDGRQTNTMGCIQRFLFRRNEAVAGKGAAASLREFAHHHFFDACRYEREVGKPGGIGFTPLLGRLKADGRNCRFPESGGESSLDLGQIGRRYEWTTYQIDIYDFVRNISQVRWVAEPLSRIIKEQVYVTLFPDYMSQNFPTDSSVVDECEVGYAFVPATVQPNFFGYGPGRFGSGFKLWRFALLETQDVEVQLVFITSPRSERVLYFWGFDPIYTSVELAEWLTRGKSRIRERVHDKFDKVFLMQHAVCHDKVIERLRPVFENTNWVAGQDGSPGNDNRQQTNIPSSV